MNFIQAFKLNELPDNSKLTKKINGRQIVFFNFNKKISALGSTCLHKGGPIDEGRIYPIEGELYVECPWHGWQYNIVTGKAPYGYEDQQSVYEIKTENGDVFISDEPIIKAKAAQHKNYPLNDLKDLQYQTSPDSINVLGISTTNLNKNIPRTSTSETALIQSLEIAEKDFGANTKLIKLRDLEFRACEGYYSKHERACTWPCSISEMDPEDGMTEVYRGLVLWADVIFVATPIRWGNASSLYFKMCERLNCVQNQITLNDKILIKNKVAGFIITGGQDNIQHVAGVMSCFFTDLGFSFPPFNFVGWSRGWTSEDMGHNVEQFVKSRYIKRSVKELVTNSINMSVNYKKMDCKEIDSPLPKRRDIGSD